MLRGRAVEIVDSRFVGNQHGTWLRVTYRMKKRNGKYQKIVMKYRGYRGKTYPG